MKQLWRHCYRVSIMKVQLRVFDVIVYFSCILKVCETCFQSWQINRHAWACPMFFIRSIALLLTCFSCEACCKENCECVVIVFAGAGGSRGSTPEQERGEGRLGTSPHINKFLAREPPDGCEKVNLKFVEDVRYLIFFSHFFSFMIDGFARWNILYGQTVGIWELILRKRVLVVTWG